MYLIGQDLTGFFVNGKLCALLIRLLNDRILDLPIDTFVLVSRLYLYDRTAVRRTFLHFRIIHPAIFKHRLIVVHVGYKDHDNRGASVNSFIAIRTTRAVVQGGDVQLIFVPIQRDLLPVKTYHTCDFLDHELPGCSVPADESESHVVAVLVGSHHGGYQGVRSGVLVDVRRVDLLGELWLFVVFILCVYPHCRRAGFRRFT